MDTDKTVQNDELETNESEHETDSTTEGEESSAEDNAERTYTEAELNERLEAERKERDKRWRERIKKAGGEESESSSQESSQPQVVESNNDVVLARLEARGVLDTDIQNYLLDEAKRLQKNPVELLSDSYYSAKLEEKKREKEQEAARPAPSSRTGTTDRSGDLNYHLQRAKDGKGLPSDPVMRRKVVAKMAGR